MMRAGDQIGPYTLITKLGRGAFGIVWLAERRTTITTTSAALKIPLDADIELEAIRQEANLWVRASGHPNVLPIIEANIYDEYVVIASEYAPDGSLEAWLNKHGGKAPSIEAAVDVISGVLAGLEHLHSRHIIHRDLKPANILFQGNTPRLADFGVSRVLKTTSQSTVSAGTPAYMAPEAFDGKRNERTDLWSIGVLFYQLLTGRLPFPQTDITSLVGAILNRNPDPLPATVPAPFGAIINRALAKDASRRYQSAAEMRADLLKATRTVGQQAEIAETVVGPTDQAQEKTVAIPLPNHQTSGLATTGVLPKGAALPPTAALPEPERQTTPNQIHNNISRPQGTLNKTSIRSRFIKHAALSSTAGIIVGVFLGSFRYFNYGSYDIDDLALAVVYGWLGGLIGVTVGYIIWWLKRPADQKSDTSNRLIKRAIKGIVIGAPAGLIILPIVDLIFYGGRQPGEAAIAGIIYGAIFGAIFLPVLLALIKYAWK